MLVIARVYSPEAISSSVRGLLRRVSVCPKSTDRSTLLAMTDTDN